MKLNRLAPLLLSGAVALGQSPPVTPAGSNWQRVTALPANTHLHINGRTRHLNCDLKSADESSLTCHHGSADETFARTDITSVKIARRGRSAAAGAAIGGGVLAIIGAVATRGNSNGFGGLKAAVIGGFTIGGALIGGGIGAATDFTPSTVYKAP